MDKDIFLEVFGDGKFNIEDIPDNAIVVNGVDCILELLILCYGDEIKKGLM